MASNTASAHPNHFSVGQGVMPAMIFSRKCWGSVSIGSSFWPRTSPTPIRLATRPSILTSKKPPKSSKVYRDRCHWLPPLLAICQGSAGTTIPPEVPCTVSNCCRWQYGGNGYRATEILGKFADVPVFPGSRQRAFQTLHGIAAEFKMRTFALPETPGNCAACWRGASVSVRFWLAVSREVLPTGSNRIA